MLDNYADSFAPLLVRVTAAVDPADAIEEIWVRDVVELAWDMARLRRLKASLLRVAAPDGLKRSAKATGLALSKMTFARECLRVSRQGSHGAPVERDSSLRPRLAICEKKGRRDAAAPARHINTRPRRLKTVLLTPLAREPWRLPASGRPQGRR